MRADPLVAAAALALSGCYHPSPPAGRPCSESGGCPDGQACELLEWVCVWERDVQCTEPPCESTVLRVSTEINRDVDILFVIDNSFSMAEEQASLAANFSRFINVLSNLEGGLPNLHVGVISTDVGVGPYSISGCSAQGDDGALRSDPSGPCTPPTGAFIEDVDDGAGGRITNYTGTLADTFSCIAQLGTQGCGFEQPLQSIRRALDGSQPINAGFLREDAQLLVVIISDEDDCSAADTSMFDTNPDLLDDLGPLTSFRCFELGVQCESGNEDPRAPGSRSGCTDASSAYMDEVYEYVEFVKGLKNDPEMIWVAGIIGDPEPVVVGSNDTSGNPELEPSCVSTAGEAAPGVRLASFLEQFPLRNTLTTICNNDLSSALLGVASLVAGGLGRLCILADIDLDPNTTNIEGDCSAYDVYANGDEVEIPACSETGGVAPCFNIFADPAQCPSSPGNLALDVVRGSSLPPNGTQLELRCLVLQ